MAGKQICQDDLQVKNQSVALSCSVDVSGCRILTLSNTADLVHGGNGGNESQRLYREPRCLMMVISYVSYI